MDILRYVGLTGGKRMKKFGCTEKRTRVETGSPGWGVVRWGTGGIGMTGGGAVWRGRRK